MKQAKAVMLPNIGKQKLLQSTLSPSALPQTKALDRKLMNEFTGDHKNLMTSQIVKQM